MISFVQDPVFKSVSHFFFSSSIHNQSCPSNFNYIIDESNVIF